MSRRTQIIRNNAALRGGKKPPKSKEYPKATEVFSPGKLRLGIISCAVEKEKGIA